MTALTKLLGEEETVTVSSIINKLADYRISFDSKTILQTLETLAGKDIVLKRIGYTVAFEFKIDLIKVWLERTKHLDQVVEEFKSDRL
jgi:hypothetical protein